MKYYLHYLIGILTAMVGYHLHHSLFWAVVDFFFYPLAILKWIVCQQLTLRVLHDTFSYFVQ